MGCQYPWNNSVRAGDGPGVCVLLLLHTVKFFRAELSSSVIYSDSSPEEGGSALLDRSHCGNNDFIMTRVCAEVKHKDHTNNSLWKVWHHRKDGF